MQLRYSLQTIYYESRLFVELYKSANYVFVVVALMLGQRIIYNIPENRLTKLILNFMDTPYGAFIIIIGFLIFVELFVKVWVTFYYERSIMDIKKVLDSLEKDES